MKNKLIPFVLLFCAACGMSNGTNNKDPNFIGFFITSKDARAVAERTDNLRKLVTDEVASARLEGFAMAFTWMAEQGEQAACEAEKAKQN
jgi:hypothetical protein